MGNTHAQGGWTISEVERLTGLPRRDIQRCCYSGKGGLDIVAPQDSTWGRRCHGVAEMAALYVVRLEKLAGESLPEIARKLQVEAAGEPFDAASALSVHAARLEQRRETIEGLLTAAHALHIAVSDGDSQSALGAFVERSAGDQLVAALRELSGEGVCGLARECGGLPAQRENACSPGFALRAGWLADALAPVAPLCERAAHEAEMLIARGLASAIDCIHEDAGVTHDLARRALSWAFDAPGMALAVELWLGAGAFDLVSRALR